MKVGIIVYSKTGNTHSVARTLEKKLTAAGHAVTVKRITLTADSKSEAGKIEFEDCPDATPYDALVFGSPVQAFSLAAPMKKYLGQTGSLRGKKVFLFVTKNLPFHWTGGSGAIGTMKKLCEASKGRVAGSGIVVWRSNKAADIANLAKAVVKAFG